MQLATDSHSRSLALAGGGSFLLSAGRGVLHGDGETAPGAFRAFILGACTAAALIFLAGCTPAAEWARNHERTYSAAYTQGGGALSMTVRPMNQFRDAGNVRDQGSAPSTNSAEERNQSNE